MSTNLIYAELPHETLCGEGVLKRTSDLKVIENYVRDESVIIIGKADEVVFPRDEKQIAEVLKEANRRGGSCNHFWGWNGHNWFKGSIGWNCIVN
jgi:FAD/FMN-containing dehydrogenase